MANVVFPLGGTGDQTTAVLIPGCVSKATWDAGVATDFMGTNGFELVSGTTKALVDQLNNFIELTDTGAFAGLTLAGMYVYCDNGAGVIEDGYYLIASHTDDVLTFADIGLVSASVYVADGNADYAIGGAGVITSGGALQSEFDHIGSFAADGTNNVGILWNRDVTLTATFDFDSCTGSTTTQVRVTGTTSTNQGDATDFINDGTLVEITTGVTLANGLMDFPITGTIFVTFANIDYNGGGAGNAAHCVNETAGPATDDLRFLNCRFRDSTDHCVVQESDRWTFDGCDFTGSLGGNGIFPNGDGDNNRYTNCRFLDNALDGARAAALENMFIGCIFAGNDRGLFTLVDRNIIINCTFFNNQRDGFGINSSTNTNHILINNTSSGNGAGAVSGLGYNLDGMTGGLIGIFEHNHSFGNLDGHTNLTSTDAEFQFLFDGHNITGSTTGLWESTTPADAGFMQPKENNPVLGAGSGQFIGTGQDGFNIGAKGPIAGGGAAGGGVMPLSGLLG